MYRAIRIQMIPQARSNQADDNEKCYAVAIPTFV
jgi:hypothetical protein